ncbi:cation-translocating P-type ATPase [Mycoplasmopsis equigenitalium]|uniref:Cation-translocating P-type ATPase n=1 Tax=Mycoplasmopsis equigenitalium TaxID=114883 RepID=A0ABY5J423_9BACT|nr:cation-translocating P-type ATPase [Mycoplasmopsis equigenitalium]UUD36700.1 cation-translocating P-type ATPase [Mycoplasmopsis equigenitalium]
MIKGLTSEKAAELQAKHGLNKLKDKKPKNRFVIFLEQFKDLMVIMLLIATIFSLSMAIYDAVTKGFDVIKFVEAGIILLVIVINAIIGLIQEIKSSQAVQALSKLNPLKVKVYRDGVVKNLDSKELTIGDVVLLESGDIVPADGILLSASELKVVETSLTGESEAISKKVSDHHDVNLPLAEQFFKVFSSTLVATGSAEFIVTQIGMDTEIGKISSMLNKQETTITPLQYKINKLGRIFGYFGLALFVLTVLMQITFQLVNGIALNNGAIWTTNIINGISLAVAAIPEGLVTFTTIILALSVQNMAKQKAIVKSLMAVETLGSTSVICSDKTGTLTQNKMTIVEHHLHKDNDFNKLLIYGSLASDAHINITNNETHFVGDPTEIAIIQKALDLKLYESKHDLDLKYKRLKVIPFDSSRKLMSSVNKIGNDYYLITKGAPEVVLQRCHLENSQETNIVKEWAAAALRTLAVAYKKLDAATIKKLEQIDLYKLENDLELVGLVGMIDPLRETSKEAIEICKRAGIRTIMITGDSVTTAKAIAKQLGIFNSDDIALEGKDLDTLSDEELLSKLEHCSVFARVAPKDKIRLVKLLQSQNNVVAMTGDGVNDAPALKAADIGCAMGITGTEVSKEAADMILVDDNFATIVSAVKNGRSIYETIRLVIKNLLITSVAEIVLVFFGLLIFNLVFKNEIKNNNVDFFILSPTQLLWINLFTHGFPAIALGLQKNDIDYMKFKPHPKTESIFARRMGIDVLWLGIFIGVMSLIAYYLAASYAISIGKPKELAKFGSSVVFLILGIAAVISSLNLMAEPPIFMTNPLKHKLVYGSVFFSVFWLILVAAVPQIAQVFKISNSLFTDGKMIAIAFGSLAGIYIVFESYSLLNKYVIK